MRLAIIAASLLMLACASPEPAAIYRPTESVLEVVSVLRLHRDDDTYRFPPARDFTGKNVYRASLERLESLEELYREKFAAGYMTAEILFAKGIALERITEYSLAARAFGRVAGFDGVLSDAAAEAVGVCDALARAEQIQPGPSAKPETALATFDERNAMLEQLLAAAGTTWHRPVVREALERADLARARYFDARRQLDPDLNALALQQYQLLLQRHAESRHRNRHLIALGDFYASLSRQYADLHPPVSLRFDPATFDEYAYSASRLYEAVSQQDGAVEKIEAGRKLEAFLAFTLEIHEQKLPR